MRLTTRATMTLATSARVAARARRALAPARGGTRTAAGVPAATLDDTDDDDDDETTPEYLARASTPSDRFQESSWGDAALAESCLRAMRVQWTHGYSSTPTGFPRCTHGFGEILAGMQPAAADVVLRECFDSSTTKSVLDPFMGGGTTLVAGQTLGWRAHGVDVSPLACFVSANRNWRADEASVEVMVETAARAVASVGARAAAAEEEGTRDGGAVDGDAARGEEVGEGDAGVPRPWLPIRRAVREATVDAPPRIAEALWFCMSVALQRTQKSQNKRRPKGRGKKNRGGGDAASANAEAVQFSKVVDEYAVRLREFKRACDRNDPPAPLASIHNVDIRKFALAEDERVDCVLTSPPYPAVYDYLSFARKVRAGSGAVVSSSSVDGPTSSYVNTVVPGDRNWPKEWLEGEIGSRRALRSDPHAFKDVWQREQEDWLRVVADSLVPGGRAAVMVGDGANINTRTSLAAAAGLFNLRDVAGCTMKLTATMSDGAVYNQARTEHLIIFEKPRE